MSNTGARNRRYPTWPAPGVPPAAATRGRTVSAAFWAWSVVAAVMLVAVEIAATYAPRWGLLGHGAFLAVILATAARTAGRGVDGSSGDQASATTAGLVALALVPLLRVIGIALPLAEASPLARHGWVAAPVLLGGLLAVRAAGFDRAAVGLRLRWRWRGVPLDLGVGIAGIALGYAQYRVLRPPPVTDGATAWSLVAAGTVFLLAGFAQEYVFRGVVQRAAGDLAGPVPAIVAAAAADALVHLAYRSPELIGIVFAAGLVLGGTRHLTGSLLGPTLARALAAVGLFALFPRYDPSLPFW